MIGRPCSCCSCRCYEQLGRIDEAERLIEDRWEHLNAVGEGALEPAIKLLRLHIELTLKATPVETIRAVLDQAARLAPDDDRVWLGRANLAIRTGAYDEAERWLDACLRRRPEDVPVWRARLSWGIATNRLDVVEQAMTHLPAAESTPAQVHRLKQVELDQLRARYWKLHERKQPIRDAVEMARLAERFGRIFEARVFLTLAISEDPDRDDAAPRPPASEPLKRAPARATATQEAQGRRGLNTNNTNNTKRTIKKFNVHSESRVPTIFLLFRDFRVFVVESLL